MSKEKKGTETENEIILYFHCGECIQQIPNGVSPSDLQNLACGWTEKGFQVWCIHCNKNVFNIDFLGNQVIAI